MAVVEYEVNPNFISFMSIYDVYYPLELMMDKELTENEKFLTAIIKHSGNDVVMDNYTVSAIFFITPQEAEELVQSLKKKGVIEIEKSEQGERILSVDMNYLYAQRHLINIAEEKLRYEIVKNNVKRYREV